MLATSERYVHVCIVLLAIVLASDEKTQEILSWFLGGRTWRIFNEEAKKFDEYWKFFYIYIKKWPSRCMAPRERHPVSHGWPSAQHRPNTAAFCHPFIRAPATRFNNNEHNKLESLQFLLGSSLSLCLNGLESKSSNCRCVSTHCHNWILSLWSASSLLLCLD